jgi:hypothetical protein
MKVRGGGDESCWLLGWTNNKELTTINGPAIGSGEGGRG